MSSENVNATDEMQDMQKEAMAEALARAKCYGIKDADEAARFASEAADKLAEVQAEAEFARDFCDIRTNKMVTDTLEATADKAAAALVDVLAVYHHLNGGTFADREENEADGIDTVEATENLTNAMYKRASEFPIASREDAIDALMDAAVGTATLAGALLALTGTKDEQASAALIRASKEAGNANMQTLRAIGYLNKCQAEKDAATGGEDLSGIPYVEVGYADGSSMRTVGHFDRHTVAEVARLITLTTAPIEEEEE